MNRSRLILAGVGLFVVLMIILAGVGIWRLRNIPSSANQKTLILKLSYCSSEDIKPCIVSFSQDGNSNMSVNVLVPSFSFPNFYLIINREAEEHRYECEKVKDVPNNFTCIGREMFPGEPLQFILVATRDNTVLAEGSFVILGLMLATPESETTDVAGAIETAEPTESATPFLLEILTPVPTPTDPLYPNPSYPNPSYPNP